MAGPKASLVAMAIITVVIVAAMAEEPDHHKWAAGAEAKEINKRLTDTRGMQPQITSRKLCEDPCDQFYCDADASCDYLLDLKCTCRPTTFGCYYHFGFKPETCDAYDCDDNGRCDHVPEWLTCDCNVDSGKCI